MASEVIFHRLVQRDMNDIRSYYIDEVGERLADRFYQAFLSVVIEWSLTLNTSMKSGRLAKARHCSRRRGESLHSKFHLL